jgi:hypothetical protein
MNNIQKYVNDEYTRSFLAINVGTNRALGALQEAIDDTMKSYHQPIYYSNPSYHFSFGCDIGDRLSPHLTLAIQREFHTLPTQGLTINAIECKVGNKLYKINLEF